MSSIDPDSPLTASEIEDLERLQARAQQDLSTYVLVGEALSEIRDRRLYRATHATFEDYLSERWGLRDEEAVPGTAVAARTSAPTEAVGAGRSAPCEALAQACEETLSLLTGDSSLGVEIRFAIRKGQDAGEPTTAQLPPVTHLVDDELVPRLRWLLTQASGMIADVAHQLETRAADIDDDAHAEMRDDVLVLDEELDMLKTLLVGFVDWDTELGRLLQQERRLRDNDSDDDPTEADG